jgi:hypothetical protein
LSSILKALKRIEGQPPPPQSFPALPDSVDAKQAINSNARKRWRLRRIITVGLVLLVIVVTAVLVFQRRQFVTSKIFPPGSPATKPKISKAPEEKSKIFRAKIPPTTVKQTTKIPEPTQPARQQTITVAPGQKTKKFRANTRSSESRVDVGQQPPKTLPAISSKQPPSGATINKPAPRQSSGQKFTPSKKSIAGKQTESSQSAAKAKKIRKANTYAKLNDSKIRLQALAWSSDAAKRMAVINGRIVREGESMDGYQINQIRQEDVVVSDDRQSWSLEFGLKQLDPN